MKKYIIFLLVLGAGNYLSAQKTQRPSFRDFLNKGNLFSPDAAQEQISTTPQINIFPKDITITEPQASLDGRTLPFLLQNGNKVYNLPQDDMPCVVPEINIYNMPVVKENLDIDKGIYVPFSQNKIGPR